jgi:hypothetical protein
MTLICITTANTTAYDCLHGLLGVAGAELERLGHEVQFLNLSAPDRVERLKAMMSMAGSREMVAMGLSGIGMEIRTDDGRLLWEVAQVPYFNWFCDHPCYVPSRHRLQSRYLVHGYLFPDHAAFTRDFLAPSGPVFAAHVGIPDPGFFNIKPFDKRNGRLVFVKSGWNKSALEEQYRATLPPKLFNILFAAIEEARGHTCGAFPEILLRVAARHLTFLTPGEDVFNALLTRLDNYTRAARAQAVGAILADYPVDFLGSGWDELAGGAKRARFLGPTPFHSVREMLGSYLGAVSLNPNVDHSVHDRVFFALGAGTVPIFDANAFSRAELPLLSRYGFGADDDSVRAAVEGVLDRPFEAQAALAATLADVYPRFSMRSSMQDIHQIMTSIAGPAVARFSPAPPAPVGVGEVGSPHSFVKAVA